MWQYGGGGGQGCVKIRGFLSAALRCAVRRPALQQGLAGKTGAPVATLLAEDGVLYLEAEAPVEALGAWKTVRQGQAGQVYFHLLRQEPKA